jgi:Cytochrome c oxidase subunit IV
MDEETRLARETPEPAGELIHRPGPSYLPVLTAAGLALAITGIVLSPIMVVIGAIITLVSIWKWIGETRREMSELPLEHP